MSVHRPSSVSTKLQHEPDHWYASNTSLHELGHSYRPHSEVGSVAQQAPDLVVIEYELELAMLGAGAGAGAACGAAVPWAEKPLLSSSPPPPLPLPLSLGFSWYEDSGHVESESSSMDAVKYVSLSSSRHVQLEPGPPTVNRHPPLAVSEKEQHALLGSQ